MRPRVAVSGVWSLGPRPAPADLAAELCRAMDAARFTRRGVTYVQTVYTLSLSAPDLARFAGRRRELVAVLKDALAWWCTRRRYRLPGDLRVRLMEDPRIRAGRVKVEAALRLREAERVGRSSARTARRGGI